MDRELKYPTRPILQCGQTKKLPIQTIFVFFVQATISLIRVLVLLNL